MTRSWRRASACDGPAVDAGSAFGITLLRHNIHNDKMVMFGVSLADSSFLFASLHDQKIETFASGNIGRHYGILDCAGIKRVDPVLKRW